MENLSPWGHSLKWSAGIVRKGKQRSSLYNLTILKLTGTCVQNTQGSFLGKGNSSPVFTRKGVPGTRDNEERWDKPVVQEEMETKP